MTACTLHAVKRFNHDIAANVCRVAAITALDPTKTNLTQRLLSLDELGAQRCDLKTQSVSLPDMT